MKTEPGAMVSWSVLLLAAASITLAPGCDGSERPRSDRRSASRASAEKRPSVSNDAVAFAYGRKYGFACVHALLDNPAESQKALAAAQTLAGGLGGGQPPAPTKANAMAAMRSRAIPDDLTQRAGARASALFSLGLAVTDGWFGATLGGDVGPAVADIERSARAAGVPDAVWRQPWTELRARPTKEGFSRLGEALERHLKR